MAVEGIDLPFEEAADYFKGKVRVPSDRWQEVWQGEHARAFTVAGAMRDEILSDFQSAIGKAIEQGTSFEQFQRDFDTIVERHGWTYRGGRSFRTRTIYRTNLTTAYHAGRHKQMTDPDVLKYRPFWRYRHGGSANPREKHLAWDGLVLRHDDAFWDTHYPPNGWGCSCRVEALSARQLRALGKTGPDAAPQIRTRPYKNPVTGETTQVPEGIDPGWAYNVGAAANGKPLAKEVMAEWQKSGARPWERLTPGDWQSEGRPRSIPMDAPMAAPGEIYEEPGTAVRAVAELFGAESKMLDVPGGTRVLVDAASLVAHIDLNRTPFLPLLPELLTDPFEIWLAFERHKGTGRVELRLRFVKGVQLGKSRFLLLSAQVRRGVLEAWTFFPTRDATYIRRQRAGKLVYARGNEGQGS